MRLLCLPIEIVKHGPATMQSRRPTLVRNRRRDVGLGVATLLDRTNESIQARHPIELVGAPQLCGIERSSKHRD